MAFPKYVRDKFAERGTSGRCAELTALQAVRHGTVASVTENLSLTPILVAATKKVVPDV